MHQPIIYEDDDMEEARDNPLEKLVTKLNRLNRGLIESKWKLRVFGLLCHVSLYITYVTI